MATRRDSDRRSEDRQAAVILRMSRREREALNRLARRRGTTVSDLLRSLLHEHEPELRETG
jgi:hypothetical protein